MYRIGIQIHLSRGSALEIVRSRPKKNPDIRSIPGNLPSWVFPSKTAREGDNYIAKSCRAAAGRNGDPCEVWKAELEALQEAIKSTRNKAEIKTLNSLKQDYKKAGKQLGCTNQGKREGEKGGDYGSIK